MQEASTVATDLSSFLTQLKTGLGDFSYGNLATIILAALGLAVSPAIFWFGYRFVKGKVSKAFFKGKL